MYRRLLYLPGLLWITALAQDQPLVITTVAGTDFVFQGDGRPATQAQLSTMYHVLADARGNVYVADSLNHQIVRVDAAGILTVVAGNGIQGFSGEGGPARQASLNFPTGMAFDAAGNLYIADEGNRMVRRVAADGTITTVAGNGNRGSTGDGGSAINATFGAPRGLAVDTGGNLYICDREMNRIRRVNPNGIISHFAGDGQARFFGDNGPATQASFRQPWHLSFDNAGNLLVGDFSNHRVRRITPQGRIDTVAGTGNAASDGDGGQATNASLIGPTSAFMDPAGTLYINEFFSRVRAVDQAGTIRTFAGGAMRGFTGDGGAATAARLSVLNAVTGDRNGNIYIADSVNLRVRRVNPQGTISTIAGVGQHRFSGDGGPAISATFANPVGLAVDALGNIYVADSDNHRVRRIAPNGIISTFAGTGVSGFSGDNGPANQAMLSFPLGLTLDAQGNLYIADVLNERVRRVTPGGIITTVAGGGNLVAPPDGILATQVSFIPGTLAADTTGNLFVLSPSNCVVVRIAPDGMLFRYAGRWLDCGSSGDGGLARDARIHPLGAFVGSIALDAAGNLYLPEPNPPQGAPPNAGGRVRVIDRAGVIRAFAGNGLQGFVPTFGLALQERLFAPTSAVADRFGNVYIGDISFVYGVGGGFILRLAGDPSATQSGDGGNALNASLTGPSAMAFDGNGNLLLIDGLNGRIRALLAAPPTQNVAPQLVAFTGESGGAPAASRNLELTASIPGVGYQVRIPADAQSWLRVNPASGSSPRLIDVTADPANLAPGFYTTSLTVETPLALPASRTVAVTFRVGPPQPPRLALDKDNLSFSYPRDSAALQQAIAVSNEGGGAINFSVAVETTAGGAWLSVSPATGTVRPAVPITLAVAANPTGLFPGTYTGRILVTGAGQTRSVAVTMTISANQRALLLSQSGLSFTAVSGGGVVPPRLFEVLNIGRGSVNFTVSVSTLAGGANWLNATPAAGVSNEGAPPAVTVSVNQTGLAPGVYYGLVRVDAPDAANSPQVVTIFLEVLPPGSDPGALVEPAELVFTTQAGVSPGSKEVFVYNIAQGVKTYRSTGDLTNAMLVTLPTNATLELSRPARAVIQPFVSNLGPGTYTGGLHLQFTDGRVRTVRIKLIVAPTALAAAGRAAGGCTPTKLVPAITSLSPSVPITVGWPVPLTAEVRDDCGDMHTSGSVLVTFSNGDSPVSLQSLRDGRWAGTWATRTAAEQTVLKVEAANPPVRLTGTETVAVNMRARQTAPVIEAAGVVSAAGVQSHAPLAPGAMISVYGQDLAEVTQSATQIPLPSRIGSTRIVIGGREAPLLFVSPTQINALVPSGININTRHQLLVQRASTYGRPVALDVAPAQPAVFTVNQSGTGQGIIVRADGRIADGANPATPGSTVVLYMSGLGATNPEVTAGEATPPSPLSTVADRVSVTIGGVDAIVDFAGLVPGFAGLYQVNVRLPAGVTGDAVQLTVRASEQLSPPVTLAIR